jgi:hypothetical protein
MAASPPGRGAVSSGEGIAVGAPRRWLGLEGLVLLNELDVDREGIQGKAVGAAEPAPAAEQR